MTRTVIKISGESGSGLLSTGEIMMHALKRQGFYMNADREYPSLIKGGFADYQIDFGLEPLRSSSTAVDIVTAVDRVGLMNYLQRVKPGGIMVHGDDRAQLITGLAETVKERKIQMVYIPAREISYSFGGNELMMNMVLLGLTWRIFGFPLEKISEEVEKRFASKPKLLEIDLQCLQAGYEALKVNGVLPELKIMLPDHVPETILINGNEAVCLGGIHGGTRAYYAYPMSPSSSILTYMAAKADETGMLVKQGEDEITVAQMSLGSMFMGTRSFCATSGGGFDLMTETVSLAGMIECPFVCVICQRPGPATGLPTWTAQGDLTLAIGSAHGEFPRIVLGASDPESCYELIQHALNLAEKYQTVVLVLTEKTIAETRRTVPLFEQGKIAIERGIVTDAKRLAELKSSDRFKITANGISERWLPGASPAHYYANSDEHWEDGTLTEEGPQVQEMMAKRLRKMELIEQSLPEPEIYGTPKEAAVSFIGWGSTKNTVLDAISEAEKEGLKINYLHYEYLWPFKTAAAIKFFAENKTVCLLEGNATAQLGTLVEDKTGQKFKQKFLKYDGRAFLLEEVLDFARQMNPSLSS